MSNQPFQQFVFNYEHLQGTSFRIGVSSKLFPTTSTQSVSSSTSESKTRIAAIEHELDIIRGRIPTPKGYVVNPLRIKELMTELKQLHQNKHAQKTSH